MSDDHVGAKLRAAVYDQDIVLGYERGELVLRYAELLASGKVQSAGPAVACVYDREIEIQKLLFEQSLYQNDTVDSQSGRRTYNILIILETAKTTSSTIT